MTREMQIETMMSYWVTPIRLPGIRELGISECWQGGGQEPTHYVPPRSAWLIKTCSPGFLLRALPHRSTRDVPGSTVCGDRDRGFLGGQHGVPNVAKLTWGHHVTVQSSKPGGDETMYVVSA